MTLKPKFIVHIAITACTISAVCSSAEPVLEVVNSVASLTNSMNHDLRLLFAKFAELQLKVNKILEKVDVNKCTPCPKCDPNMKAKLNTAEESLEHKQRMTQELSRKCPSVSSHSLLLNGNILSLACRREKHDFIQS